jgi:hypothetical protein
MPGFPDRCQHIKINGTQCGSPALRRSKFCYFHKRFREQRIPMNRARSRRRCATLDLPLLEDANSIQVALMEVLRLLALGHIDSKAAGLYLYALQTASANLARTSLEPLMHEVILNLRDVDQTPLGGRPWEDEDFEEEEADDEEEEEPIVLTESEKAAILAERDRRAKAEQHQLAWANSPEERADIRRKFAAKSLLSPEHQHALMKRLSQLVAGPTPPSVKEIRDGTPD